MIDRKHRLSVTHQAQLLGISRGAVYCLPQAVAAADLALLKNTFGTSLSAPRRAPEKTSTPNDRP
jgi:putative transposase